MAQRRQPSSTKALAGAPATPEPGVDGSDAWGPALTRRDADPLALALLTQLGSSTSVDRMLVWRALGSRVAGGLSERGQQAGDAAALCFDDVCTSDLGRDPDKALSEREYGGWYEREREAGRKWPSVSSLKKWLGGSWPCVQDALGQSPTVSMTARRLAAQGGEFKDEDLTTQLRKCREALAIEADGPGAEALDYVTQRLHRQWALKELAKPAKERVLPRLCLQPHPFRDAFGSWPAAVIASGGGKGPEAALALARVHAREGEYTDDDCVAAVARVGAECGGEKMTWKKYTARARKLRKEAATDGEVLYLPSPEVVVEHLGSWPEALLAAGFIDEAECQVRLARVSPTLTDDELLAIFAEALAVLGPYAREADYVGVRDERRIENGGRPDWPGKATIYQRLGKWDEAVAAAFEAYPELLDQWEQQLSSSLEREAA